MIELFNSREINLTDSSLELLYDINAEKNFKEFDHTTDHSSDRSKDL